MPPIISTSVSKTIDTHPRIFFSRRTKIISIYLELKSIDRSQGIHLTTLTCDIKGSCFPKLGAFFLGFGEMVMTKCGDADVGSSQTPENPIGESMEDEFDEVLLERVGDKNFVNDMLSVEEVTLGEDGLVVPKMPEVGMKCVGRN